MKEIESIASALFDKVRSRFTNVTLGNEKAEAENDPEKARFFNFDYVDQNGKNYGKFGNKNSSRNDLNSLAAISRTNRSFTKIYRKIHATWWIKSFF